MGLVLAGFALGFRGWVLRWLGPRFGFRILVTGALFAASLDFEPFDCWAVEGVSLNPKP